MKVYRIEHEKMQCGPYQGGAAMSGRYWDEKTCPGACDDGLRDISYEEVFGFKSVRQLLDWFRLWDIWTWRKSGFAVYRYSIADEYVRFGGKQLVFVQAKAQSRQQVRWLPLQLVS